MELKIVQNAYIVDDIFREMERMNRVFGIGPFIGGDIFELTDHVYRGKAADTIRARLAFVQTGDITIELIQRVSFGPDAYGDMFPHGGNGLHHCATFCSDYAAAKEELIASGFPVASEFTSPWGTRFAYVDTRAVCGHMTELYPDDDETLLDLYKTVSNARDKWDGTSLTVPWNA